MTEYSRDKQRKLVELLYKKTLERGIKWATNEEKQLFATISGRLLFVYDTINEQGEELIKFSLFDLNDKLSDSFTDETIKDPFAPRGFENWFTLCAALLEMGRRQASGADDALDAMLNELDDDVPF